MVKKKGKNEKFGYYITSSNWGTGSKTRFFSFVSKKTKVATIHGSITSKGHGEYEVIFHKGFKTKKVTLRLGRGFRLTRNNIRDVLILAYKKVFGRR